MTPLRQSFATRGSDGGTGAEIVTDDLHLVPAQGAHALAQVILQALAFLVLPYLFVCRLPEVDDGFAGQVLRFDLGAVQQLCHRRSFPSIERPPPAEQEWSFQGSTVCDGFDPEGNVIQFREQAR
jgi:hypothetical protein